MSDLIQSSLTHYIQGYIVGGGGPEEVGGGAGDSDLAGVGGRHVDPETGGTGVVHDDVLALLAEPGDPPEDGERRRMTRHLTAQLGGVCPVVNGPRRGEPQLWSLVELRVVT